MHAKLEVMESEGPPRDYFTFVCGFHVFLYVVIAPVHPVGFNRP